MVTISYMTKEREDGADFSLRHEITSPNSKHNSPITINRLVKQGYNRQGKGFCIVKGFSSYVDILVCNFVKSPIYLLDCIY